MSTSIAIQAIVPFLENDYGHFLTYHLAAQEASARLGWHYEVAAPETCSCTVWPSHWNKCLPQDPPSFSPKWIWRLWKKYRYSASIYRLLKDMDGPERKILFIEYISVRQLRRVAQALSLCPTKRFELWFCHRQAPYQLMGTEKQYHKCFQKLVKILGRENILFLADTVLLKQLYEELWEFPIHVLPIPHTGGSLPHQQLTDKRKVTCWYQMHTEHGMRFLEKFSKSTSCALASIRLMFPNKCLSRLTSSPMEFVTLPNVLSIEEYRQCMADSDVLLLPYEKKNFVYSSSGRFVEAIAYGKIPLVTPGTWSASELSRYGLDDLVVDWERPDLIDYIMQIANDPALKQKLQKMQQAYASYHSVESFSNTFAHLAEIRAGKKS